MKKLFLNCLCLLILTLCAQAQNPNISRDALFYPSQQINDPNTSGFNEFGAITKIQGQTMVITAPITKVVYVYRKTSTNGSWQLNKTLKPSSSGCGTGNCTQGFGTGVAIAPNERIIVIHGSKGIYIYEKTNTGIWNQFETQFISMTGNCDGKFSIAISEVLNFQGANNSGVRIAVGRCDINNQSGVTTVLHKRPISSVNPTKVWQQEKTVSRSGGNIRNTFFGNALAWSGSTLFVSAPGENDGRGVIYTFRVYEENSGIAGFRMNVEHVKSLSSTDSRPNDLFGSTLIANSTRLVTCGGKKAYVFYKNTLNPLNHYWPQTPDKTLISKSSTSNFGKDLTFTTSGFAIGTSSKEVYNYEFSGSTIRLREIIKPESVFDQPLDIFGGSLAASGNDLFVYSKSQSNSRSFVRQLVKANPITTKSILTNFYRATGRSNWSNNNGWDTTQKIRYWYGVSTDVINGTERVTALSLSNNNLKGRIHSQLDELDYLTSLDLSNNALNSSIPDFSSNTNLTDLNLSNNNYQFGDLEDNFTDYQDALGANYVYAPQKELPSKPDFLAGLGEQISIPADVSGTQNNYIWYKRNADNTSNVVSTSETLTLIMDSSSFGSYFLEVTNNLVPNLKLTLPDFSISQRGADYEALLAFYNATNGANWTTNTNWLDNTQPISTWHGVTVENGRVVNLNLNNNNLSGSIPAEIEGLTFLKTLYLYNNPLSGTIPSEIGNLSNLEALNLSLNSLTGSIPSELGLLSNLKNLILNDTNLIGQIPETIGNLSNLESLRLVRVPLSGALPSELMNCINLKDILISETNIEGAIPSEIGQLQNLTRLLIYQNTNMSGEIPEELGSISSLQYISIFENNLDGNIPNSLTNLQNLITLELRNNNLTGFIPDFTNLSQLEYLLLGYNKFQFGDLEPNFNFYKSNLSKFDYAPQNSVSKSEYIQGDIGSTIVLKADNSGINNTYQWYKDNTLLPGETNISLELTNVQPSDYGSYFCGLNNTLVVDMTLFSDFFEIGNLKPVPSTAIPDPNFEQLLINLGLDSGALNGGVPTANIENVTILEVPSANIFNLAGIQDFTALEEFSLASNTVNSLDFSSNPNLKKVTIYNNPIFSVNLTKNALLTDLIVSNTTGLSLSAIDLAQNNNLKTLDLSTNNISSINLNNNAKLILLRIGNNPINSLDISKNLNLEILSTWSTAITNLDLSNHKHLKELRSYSGELTNLNLKNGNNSSIDFIDVSSNPNLTCIEVDSPFSALANTNWIKDPTPTTIYSLDCTSEVALQEEERNTLIRFYNATTGANWFNNLNWLSTEPVSKWSGVTVNEFNRVKELVLVNNNLTSTEPLDLGSLSELEILSLANNNISSPNLSGFKFPQRLTSLIIPGNNISGNIPATITNLLNLNTLILSANNLDGSIPSAIGNLSNLNILFLQDNNLSGALPDNLGNLTNLEVVNLSNNALSGSLPSNISNPNLIRFFISFNEFSGLLPDFSGAPLEQLWVDNNNFYFSDLLPLVESNIVNSFLYSPQRTKDVAQNLEFAIGADIVLNIDDTNLNKTKSLKGIGDEYQWFKDSIEINGANQGSFTIVNAQELDSGIYHCEITNPLLPDLIIKRANITIIIDSNLSLKEIDNTDATVFPNPTKNTLNLILKNSNKADLNIYDIHGRLISRQKIKSKTSIIDTSHLNSGLYLFEMITKNSTIIKRIAKR
ncbi:T9SS type A sorting domain-containing protein [Algibacter mikhailovii]|nr:T9SS type A sorting domain-containing protein [Algibacter mikhailovii]